MTEHPLDKTTEQGWGRGGTAGRGQESVSSPNSPWTGGGSLHVLLSTELGSSDLQLPSYFTHKGGSPRDPRFLQTQKFSWESHQNEAPTLDSSSTVLNPCDPQSEWFVKPTIAED